ncbi:MAG TPA: ATP-binding cassette domain-containing protein [Candidatus Acidoferrum sp.]|nr:ATP-binding cassette domain-containing protein [Candidatus Acidoferrum sp.]
MTLAALARAAWPFVISYFRSFDRKVAIALLAAGTVAVVTGPIAQTYVNKQGGAMITALSTRNAALLYHEVGVFAVILAVFVPIGIAQQYLPDLLQNHWRRHLTHQFLGTYFTSRGYYRVAERREVDNPDQRISEDVSTFTGGIISLFNALIGAVAGVFAPAIAIFRIDATLLWTVVLYAALGTAIGFVVFQSRLRRLNFAALRRQADLRFGLIRVRDNAESIAFYQGERDESAGVRERLDSAIGVNLAIARSQYFFLSAYSALLQNLPIVLPILVLGPRVLAKTMPVGTVLEVAGDVSLAVGSLTVLIGALGSIGQLSAVIERLGTLRAATAEKDEGPRIAVREAPALQLDGVTILTPDRSRELLADLSLSLDKGSRILVRGPSGSGKSSLLRAIARLWTAGSGTIQEPPLDQLFFLPQTPYIIQGSLRDQLSYPHPQPIDDDAALRSALAAVDLEPLIERAGGLDATYDFERVLSLGEQQRIAFARLILAKPLYALLDEATSALDVGRQRLLYRSLAGATQSYLSVGHRPELLQFHDQVLDLCGDGRWTLAPIT